MDIDAIYCGDSRQMSQIEDGSVQLIVTSPPYNVGKAYDSHSDDMGLHDYLAFLGQVWQECVRVLCEGGRLAVNVANTFRQPYIPLNAHIALQLSRLGLKQRGEIIWDKGASVGVSTAWGSFARATNPVLRDVHEYIMVFSKGSFHRGANGRRSGITNQEFVDWTRSIWQMPTESASRAGHPAPFPEELPRRLILLYTNQGELVLDPFMGSGSTAAAAHRLGRHYIGYDVSEDYCAIARRRLAAIPIPLPLEHDDGQ